MPKVTADEAQPARDLLDCGVSTQAQEGHSGRRDDSQEDKENGEEPEGNPRSNSCRDSYEA